MFINAAGKEQQKGSASFAPDELPQIRSGGRAAGEGSSPETVSREQDWTRVNKAPKLRRSRSSQLAKRDSLRWTVQERQSPMDSLRWTVSDGLSAQLPLDAHPAAHEDPHEDKGSLGRAQVSV